MASAETQKRDRAMSWEDKEAAAVKELVASLPAWEGRWSRTRPYPSRRRCGPALDRGLRYYHRRNAEPRDRVELVVAVRAGSIDERDEERGLAHVLEHLAFRAERRGRVLGRAAELEARGVKFGSHQNAYTSFEETCYWLHVPSDFFGRALELLGALVGDVRISDDDVDKERAIVLEEWRQGKDWAQRAAESHFRFTFAGSRLADRLPIGSLDAIDAAFSKHFDARRTSDRPWPRDAAAFYPAGADAFGSRVLQKVAEGETPKLRVNVYEDAEATSTAATLSCCRPFVAPATVGSFETWLLDDVYQQILNRRLQKLSMLATPPFAHASAGTERPVCLAASGRAVSVATLSVQPLTRGDAAQALAAAWRCVEDTRAGVSEEELRMAKREILSDLKMQWLEKDQQESSTLADEARDHFLLRMPPLDVRDEVALTAAIVRGITVEGARSRADALFPAGAKLDAVVGCTQPLPRARWFARLRGLDAAEAGAAATADALRGAGQVVSKARHDLPGLATPALELRLDNGLTVVFLRTDFRDDEVVLYGAAPGGLSTVCGRSATLTPLAFAARFASSLAREYGPFGAPKALLADALGGRRVRRDADVDAYRRVLSGDCAVDELETLLALTARHFHEPLKRSAGRLETLKRLARENVRERWRDPKARYAKAIDEVNTRDHPYWRPASLADVDTFDAAASADFYDAAFSSPEGFALCFSGTFDVDDGALEELVKAYLGPLRPRGDVDRPEDAAFGFGEGSGALPAFGAARAIAPLDARFPDGGPHVRVVHAPLASVETDDDAALRGCQSRLSFPVKVAGVGADDVYDVSSRISFATADPLNDAATVLAGVLGVSASHDPDAADFLESKVLETIAALTSEGPARRDLDNALAAAKNDRSELLRRNTFWAPALASTFLTPRYRGDLGATYAETHAVRDDLHAALGEASGPDAVRGARATGAREPDQGALSPRRMASKMSSMSTPRSAASEEVACASSSSSPELRLLKESREPEAAERPDPWRLGWGDGDRDRVGRSPSDKARIHAPSSCSGAWR
ncbi:M16 peptidase-like protein [Aureococcus anophagefferens]|nr:M16 peptidase-like protein [Aureococcus anophagefferens]